MNHKRTDITDWQPTAGWLMLLPTKLPEKTEAGIVLPDTFTSKNTSGIVFAAGHEMDQDLIDKEVFFPRHEEYQIVDSDTNRIFYVVPSNKVILTRVPRKPEKFLKVGVQGTRTILPLERSK
jgi:co-chaperonin GroES (HSP10)